jgi:hypothetical protein
VEIGTEAAQFPEKEYINGIFVAVFNMHSLLYWIWSPKIQNIGILDLKDDKKVVKFTLKELRKMKR